MHKHLLIGVLAVSCTLAGCGDEPESVPGGTKTDAASKPSDELQTENPKRDPGLMRVGKLVQLRYKSTLAEREGGEHFFVHLQAVNLTKRPISIDLRDYWLAPRPNQWGGLDAPQRAEIDESRIEIKALTQEREAELRRLHAAQQLDVVPAGGTLDFYVEFNASSRADVDAVESPYVFVCMDGALDTTDGETVERLSLAWNHEGDGDDLAAHLMLKTPVVWQTIARHARVLSSP